jgi:hypothetical protein
MRPEHPSHRIMLFRTRITNRWAVWGGMLPFRRNRHQLTAHQRRAQFQLECLFWAFVLLWVAFLIADR